jgi:hypothetical protein
VDYNALLELVRAIYINPCSMITSEFMLVLASNSAPRKHEHGGEQQKEPVPERAWRQKDHRNRTPNAGQTKHGKDHPQPMSLLIHQNDSKNIFVPP